MTEIPPDPNQPPLILPWAIHEAMVAHCRLDAPLEACGLLSGVGRSVQGIFLLRNREARTDRYDAEPLDLLHAWRCLRRQNQVIVGLYHSHPQWRAVPSRTDLERNYHGDTPRIIVSLLDQQPDVRVWRLDAESYEEIPWRLSRDPVLHQTLDLSPP